jgi:hypothetical protein
LITKKGNETEDRLAGVSTLSDSTTKIQLRADLDKAQFLIQPLRSFGGGEPATAVPGGGVIGRSRWQRA